MKSSDWMDDLPQVVLSPWQRREGLPRDIWARVLCRLADGAITMDPRELAQGILPYVALRHCSCDNT
jgi:hypothetical protein